MLVTASQDMMKNTWEDVISISSSIRCDHISGPRYGSSSFTDRESEISYQIPSMRPVCALARNKHDSTVLQMSNLAD
jgi:hypothetical protein